MFSVAVLAEIFLTVFIGLSLGSFASAVSWRVPRGISWIVSGGRAAQSACPACGHILCWRDLIPLVSWVSQRGRCRYCAAPIGWRYPCIEVSVLVLCLAVYAQAGFSPAGILLMLATPFLVAMIAIDFEYMILPDQINIILGAIGLGYALTQGVSGIVPAALAAIVYAGLAFFLGMLMKILLRKEALGMGDIKFFGVAGLWLGLGALPAFLVLSGVFGVVVGLFFRISKRGALFPFGPALVLALVACLLFLPENGGFPEFFGLAIP